MAVEVKQAVVELADKMRPFIGAVTEGKVEVDGSMYEKTLPESLTMEVIKQVSDHNTNFVAAGTRIIRTAAIEAMANDKSLNEVSSTIKMGANDKLNINVERTKSYANHLQGGVETTKYAVTTVGYEVQSGKNGGQLKVVRTEDTIERDGKAEMIAELLK